MARRNKNVNLGPVLISFAAIFSVIGMIFETVAIVFGYDPNMRVFKLGSKAASASVAVLFIISIAMIAIAICVGMLGKMRSKASNSGLSDVLSSIGGFMTAVSAVLLLMEAGKANWEEAGALKLFSVILVIISVPSALSFFLGTENKNKFTTAMAFFPPIWNAVCLIRLYFDSETAINDPVRILLQITLVAVMLALMYDLKLRIKGTGKVMFTVTASLATVLACSSFMSVTLLFIMWKAGNVGEMLLTMGTLLIALNLILRLGGYYAPTKERD